MEMLSNEIASLLSFYKATGNDNIAKYRSGYWLKDLPHFGRLQYC